MRFGPSVTNNYYKIDEIVYVMKVKLEQYDSTTHSWSGVPKNLRVAPISGLGQRWYQNLNVKLNQTPISAPSQVSFEDIIGAL